MEFMQFHPTVLYIAGSSRSLITEAMRGEGAWLVDRNGHRFMPDYDPRGELAPRDVVSQAIVTPDGEDAAPERLSRPDAPRPDRGAQPRFPGIAAICAEFGLDITRDRIPVRPGAHYMIGGVTVDSRAARRCRACGRPAKSPPAACTGPIGWPRTACWKGWSTARTPAQGAARGGRAMADDFRALPLENPPRRGRQRAAGPGRHPQLAEKPDVAQRGRAPRRRAAWPRPPRTIDRWCRYVLARQFTDPAGWELQNMLTVARLMIEAALAREETRGVHLSHRFSRTDDATGTGALSFCRADATRRGRCAKACRGHASSRHGCSAHRREHRPSVSASQRRALAPVTVGRKR